MKLFLKYLFMFTTSSDFFSSSFMIILGFLFLAIGNYAAALLEFVCALNFLWMSWLNGYCKCLEQENERLRNEKSDTPSAGN